MLGVTLVGTILFAQKMPSSELMGNGWMDLSDAHGFASSYLGGQIRGLALGLACLCLPVIVLLVAGSAASSPFRARSSLLAAARPAAAGDLPATREASSHGLLIGPREGP